MNKRYLFTYFLSVALIFSAALTRAQVITTYAGVNGSTDRTGDGGAATLAHVGLPNGVATDTAGNIYFTDYQNHVVRKVTTSGVISTVAGVSSGSGSYSGDGGAATSAHLNSPTGICVDQAGNIYIADQANFRIRKVNTSGIISTYAGNGTGGYSGDGASAISARISCIDVAISRTGVLYIADGISRIRSVSASGIISTFAGNDTADYRGDGGAATLARLNQPTGVCVDTFGKVYIADFANNVIRAVNNSGIISTVAGNGTGAGAWVSIFDGATGGYTGDGGAATDAELNQPSGIACDLTGNLYISDMFNYVVRYVDIASGLITTYAGNSSMAGGYSGDGGQATAAGLNFFDGSSTSYGMYSAVDKKGNLFIADYGNNVIRKVNAPFKIFVARDTICTGTSTRFTSSVLSGTTHFHWFKNTTSVGSDSVAYTASGLANGDVIRCVVTGATTADTVAVSNSITMRVIALPNAGTITGGTVVCVGQNLTLSNATSGGTWSSGSTSNATITTGGIVRGVASGTTIISYSVTNFCGTAVDTQLITVNALPTIGTSPTSATICSGTSTTVSGTGGTTYSWSPATGLSATTGTSITASPTSTTTYTVTGVSAAGCSNTGSITITVNATPTVTATSDAASYCNGNSTTLRATGGTTYSWSPATGLSATIGAAVTCSVTATTTYTVTGTTGSCSDTGVRTITVNPLPTVSATAIRASICLGDTTTLSTTGSSSGLTYAWTPSFRLSATTGASVVSSATTTTTYSVTGTNGSGCSNTASQTITVNPIPTISVTRTADTICYGRTDTFRATGGSTYSWAPTTGLSATTGATVVASPTTTTTYTLTGTSAAGCSGTFTFTIRVNPLPAAVSAITGAHSLCMHATTTLSNSTSGGSWRSSDTSTATIGATTGIVTGVLSSDSVTMYYTVSNSCGSSSDSFRVLVHPLPNAGVLSGATNICVGSTSSVSSSSATFGTWSSTSTSVATVDGSGLVTGVGVGFTTIKFIVTSPYGCGSDTARFNDTVITVPTLTAISGVSTVCEGATITLTNSTSGGTWSVSNTTRATIDGSGVVHGIVAGSDTVKYRVTNICGADSVLKAITINPLPHAGTIVGASVVCGGSSITLTDTPTVSGTWSVINTSLATISSTGVLSGMRNGFDTVLYTVTNSCGNDVARFPVYVDSVTLRVTGYVNPIICSDGSISFAGLRAGATYNLLYSRNSLPDTTFGITASGTGTYTLNGLYPAQFNDISVISANGCRSTGIVPASSPIVLTDTTHLTLVDTLNPSYCGASDGHIKIGGMRASSAYTLHIRRDGTYTSDTITSDASGNYTISGLSVGLYQYIYVTIGHHVTGTDSCNSNTLAGVTGSFITLTNPSMPAITGTNHVCNGLTTALSDALSGGTWSSASTGIASVSTTGVVTGMGAGSTTISYSTSAACTATIAFTVNATPSVAGNAVRGTICSGDTTSLSTSGASTYSWAPGGGLSTTTGSVVVFSGTTSASYTVTGTSSAGCTNTATVGITVNAIPVPTITATSATYCVGSSSSLTATGATSYSWAPATGLSATAGSTVSTSVTSTTTYTVTGTTSGCSGTVTQLITVNPVPTVTATASPAIVCAGSSSSLTAATATSYSWAPSSGLSATTGSVVSATPGATTTYTVTGSNSFGCTDTGLVLVTVNAIPVLTVTPTSGAICSGSTTHINVSGANSYSWSPAIGLSATTGSDVVFSRTTTTTYTVTGTSAAGCVGTTTVTVTVNPLPNAGTISGSNNVCVATTTTLSSSVTGGTWVSSNTALATVASGVVGGVSVGVDTIMYIFTNSCGSDTARHPINVLSVPVIRSIAGPDSVCLGDSVTLSDSATGGTWSSLSPTVATINPTTGVVHGLTSGTCTIVYAIGGICGSTNRTMSFRVMPLPNAGTISGTSVFCAGTGTTFTSSATGGVWSSSSTSIATVGSGSGIVTGSTAGNATISYSVTNSCGTAVATFPITIQTFPTAGTISGADSVCAGNNTSLTSTISGGAWSSATPTIATVSTGGTVFGLTNGTAIISYGITNTCGTGYSNFAIIVNPRPDAGTIIGLSAICATRTATLRSSSAGGTWSSLFTSIATISASGVVTGVATGSDTIYYLVTNSCGTDIARYHITVNPLPVSGTISGADSVCRFATTTLTDGASGGVWSSSDTSIATISSFGVVSGVRVGATIISYSVTNSCGTSVATKSVYVKALPDTGSISGVATVCEGATISLSESVSGGVWMSSNTARATVTSAGVVTGVSAGAVTISYSVTNSCRTLAAVHSVIVNPLPHAGSITGTSTVCEGSSVSLGSTITGGTWSGSTSIATVSSTGGVTGAAAGTITVTFIVSNSCGADTTTRVETVNPLPHSGTILGPTTICVSSRQTLSDTATGGAWSSTNTSVASVTSTGDLYGIAAGSATIRYIVTNSCGSDTATLTVNVLSSPGSGTITGPANVCVGTPASYSDTITGGAWSLTNATLATINSSGVVSAISGGSDTVVYTVSTTCGTVRSIFPITLTPRPNAGTITGLTSVCVSAAITLSDLTSGGVWSMSNANATISSTGVVTGITAGLDTAIYTFTNACGSATTKHAMTVNPLADAGTITGSTFNICIAGTQAYTSTISGGTWTVAAPSIATIDGTGVVTGVSAGTTNITYSVSNICGTARAVVAVHIFSFPSAGTISGPAQICIGTPVRITSTITGGTWVSSNTALATITASSGVADGLSAGLDTFIYTMTNVCGTDSATIALPIIPIPNAGRIFGTSNLCIGGTGIDSSTVLGGRWSTASSFINIDSVTGSVTGRSVGTAIITYQVRSVCGSAIDTAIVVVRPNPDFTSSTNPPAICSGTVFNYTPGSSSTGATFVWSRATVLGLSNAANSGSGNPMEVLDDTTTASVSAVYNYTITSVYGCISNQNVTARVNPAPQLVNNTRIKVCSGAEISFTPASSLSSTTFRWSRASVTGITPASGAGFGSINESLVSTNADSTVIQYVYTLTSGGCSGSDTLIAVIDPQGVKPIIQTHSNAWVCRGTKFQNFGAYEPPATTWNYVWSATNAEIFAEGNGHQYSLVNFNHDGFAQIFLESYRIGYNCPGRDTFSVMVGDVDNLNLSVIYNSGVFLATGDMASYQWGYDDANTLDSSIIAGETTQTYLNASPDFTRRHYWVITTKEWCAQKTYFNAPLGITNVNDAVASGLQVFPNPNEGTFKIQTEGSIGEDARIVVTDLAGAVVFESTAKVGASMEVQLNQPDGVYMISMVTQTGRVTTKVVLQK